MPGTIQDQYDWFEEQNDNNANIEALTLFNVALQLTQLAAYYTLADDAIDDRDDLIDDQLDFLKKLEAFKCGADWEMIKCKKNVLEELEIPNVDMCESSTKCKTEIMNDGVATDLKSEHLAEEACGDIPECWGLHDGNLFAAKAASYVGGITANAQRRRAEEFQTQKTDLVRAAQQGSKSLFTSNSILAKYSQGSAIHSGLADLFIQGFNSAGAGLGVSLGQLGSNSTVFDVGGNAGGAPTGIGNGLG